MSLRHFSLTSLPPFADQEVDCGPGLAELLLPPDSGSPWQPSRVHIFTGPNGTGKSRLLQMLALATAGGIRPEPSGHLQRIGALTPWVFGRELEPKIEIDTFPEQLFDDKYSPDVTCQMGAASLTLDASPPAQIFTYQCGHRLRDEEVGVLDATDVPPSSERLCFDGPLKTNVCQHLANIKVQAAMENLNASNGEKAKRWLAISTQLEAAITAFSGRDFKVIMTTHPKPELKFSWGGDVLPIWSLPAGLSSALNWILEILIIMDVTHPDSLTPLAEPALVFLDEPETHLHPAWQRKILPMALDLFPETTFIVASHSPFIVSSINHGLIYKLYTEEKTGNVHIAAPEAASEGDSYITATKTILGVKEWYDVETEEKLATFRGYRGKALAGDAAALEQALNLADEIAGRSKELANIMGMEIQQLKATASAG